ncbi:MULTISPECIES: DUF1493 family protein [Pseudomonas]|uniref:DUF1493 family protein n=1 Tax=Pseudomonadaceae TaxID=135621 RepID=UPI0005A2BEA3|nr:MULTISPECIES: DUF1493 family protein [Pseudomonas]
MDSNDEFLELVQKHKSAHASVSLSSRVVDDLGIDGDDAEELIEELNTKFKPQAPEENWSKYFHTEAELLSWSYYLRLLMYKAGIRKSPPLRNIEPLTVKKLMELYNAHLCNV